MPVPQRIPLPESDDRFQRVVLQQQDPAWSKPGGPLGQGGGLIGRMHQAEAVDDEIGPLAGRCPVPVKLL